MYNVIKDYCENESETGLFLIDMPTGSGKTYHVLKYIFDSCQLKANRDKKYFFITPMKKNLPSEDLKRFFDKAGKTNEFDQKVLFINSISETVMENYSCELERSIPNEIKNTKEFTELRQKILLLRKYKESSSQLVLDMIPKSEEDFQETERIFRKMLSNALRKYSSPEERLHAIKTDKKWKWIGKLYPSEFTSESGVLGDLVGHGDQRRHDNARAAGHGAHDAGQGDQRRAHGGRAHVRLEQLFEVLEAAGCDDDAKQNRHAADEDQRGPRRGGEGLFLVSRAEHDQHARDGKRQHPQILLEDDDAYQQCGHAEQRELLFAVKRRPRGGFGVFHAGQRQPAEKHVGSQREHGHGDGERRPKLDVGVAGNVLRHGDAVGDKAVDGDGRKSAGHDTAHGDDRHHQHGDLVLHSHVQRDGGDDGDDQAAGTDAGDDRAADEEDDGQQLGAAVREEGDVPGHGLDGAVDVGDGEQERGRQGDEEHAHRPALGIDLGRLHLQHEDAEDIGGDERDDAAVFLGNGGKQDHGKENDQRNDSKVHLCNTPFV